MSKHDYPDIAAFVAELGRQGMAAKTITTYMSDLVSFSRWFTDSTGEAFRAAAVTPTDVLDYKAHLRTVQRRQAATVNRRLAALRRPRRMLMVSSTVGSLTSTCWKRRS